jgi:hypothetical protein
MVICRSSLSYSSQQAEEESGKSCELHLDTEISEGAHLSLKIEIISVVEAAAWTIMNLLQYTRKGMPGKICGFI